MNPQPVKHLVVTISIDEELWKEWIKFVIDKTGSARKLSEEIENALREYMKKKKRHSKYA